MSKANVILTPWIELEGSIKLLDFDPKKPQEFCREDYDDWKQRKCERATFSWNIILNQAEKQKKYSQLERRNYTIKRKLPSYLCQGLLGFALGRGHSFALRRLLILRQDYRQVMEGKLCAKMISLWDLIGVMCSMFCDKSKLLLHKILPVFHVKAFAVGKKIIVCKTCLLFLQTISNSLSFHSLAKHGSYSDAKRPRCYIAVVGVRVSFSAYTEVGVRYCFSNVKSGMSLVLQLEEETSVLCWWYYLDTVGQKAKDLQAPMLQSRNTVKKIGTKVKHK